jgi:hypothetical protein
MARRACACAEDTHGICAYMLSMTIKAELVPSKGLVLSLVLRNIFQNLATPPNLFPLAMSLVTGGVCVCVCVCDLLELIAKAMTPHPSGSGRCIGYDLAQH